MLEVLVGLWKDRVERNENNCYRLVSESSRWTVSFVQRLFFYIQKVAESVNDKERTLYLLALRSRVSLMTSSATFFGQGE